MSLRRHQLARGYREGDPMVDDVVRYIRRLVLHRGFDRTKIGSPLLKRITPSRGQFGQFAEGEARRRVQAASLDRNALSYLLRSLETELDEARLRLT